MQVSETDPRHSKFAALSHRWGAVQPLCLSRIDIQECNYGIGWSLLRNTFQDAITITWRKAVWSYSPLKLTRESEKFSALSGVADFCAQHFLNTNNVYLAGLWKASLSPDLYWRCTYISERYRVYHHGTDIGELPTRYRAPSWSWASIIASVTYLPIVKPNVEILEASCTLRVMNPFGEVTDGHLIVKGSVITIQMERSAGEVGGKVSYSLK
jgi:hypothetical protein